MNRTSNPVVDDGRRSLAHARPTAPRVLVVEDDGEVRASVVSALARDGYHVFAAASEAAAVQIVDDLSVREWSRSALDLVLIDVRIAGGSGLRLAEQIRTSGWPTAVILMTAFPDPEVQSEARCLGVTLLTKPFRLEYLRRVVLTTLVRRR